MTMTIDLPDSVLRRAEVLAQEEGFSLDQWIAATLAQKVKIAETTGEFFRSRALRAGKGLGFYLDQVPEAPPLPGDELPPEISVD